MNHYARSTHLHNAVLRTEVCDDYAISAVATLLNSPRQMTHVAINMGKSISVDFGKNMHNDSLSARKTHYAKRAACPREVSRAISADQARPLEKAPFVASSLYLQCTADGAAGALRFSASSVRAHADAGAALAEAKAQAESKLDAIQGGPGCCGKPVLARRRGEIALGQGRVLPDKRLMVRRKSRCRRWAGFVGS